MNNSLIALLYLIIAVLFSVNLGVLFQKLREGSKKVNLYSLLATSSLILNFISLAYYFEYDNSNMVIISQTYIIACIVIIKFLRKSDSK
jgi:hypothetical protein